ncbi:MAG: CHAT domain-containing tetratricopeptide repeat protein [Bryobacteraceae bacterium]
MFLAPWSRAGAAFALLALAASGCRTPDARTSLDEAREAYHRGDHASARETIRRGIEDSPDRAWRQRFEILRCRVLLTDGEHERVTTILASFDADAAAKDPWIDYIRGRLALESHPDYSLAGQHFDRAIARSRTTRDVELLTEALVKRAGIHAAQRRTGEAVELLGEAVRVAESGGPFEQGVAALNLGLILNRDRAEHDAAIEALERAASAAHRAQARLLESAARNNLGDAYRMVGEYDRALATLHEALVAENEAKSDRLTVDTLNLIGLIHVQRGEFDRSFAYLERALRMGRALNLPAAVKKTANNLTEAYLETGRLDRAAAVSDEVRQLFERYPQLTGREYLDLNLAHLTLARGGVAESIGMYDAIAANSKLLAPVRWEAEAGLARAHEQARDEAAARVHYRAALDIIEQAQSSQVGEESRLSFLTQVMRFYRGYAAMLVREGNEDAALAVEDSSRARSLAAQIEGGGEVRRADLAARLGRMIPRGVALVAYWIGPQGSYARVISGGRHERIPLAASPEELTRWVRSWRTFLERDRGDPLSGGEPAGEKLYGALVAPLGGRVRPGSRVVIVPDGPLHGLNFETLPEPGAQRLWIDDVTVSIAPSLGLLAGAGNVRAGRRSLLLIGDPVANGPEFPRLSAAGTEIEAVRRGFPDAVVKQDVEATPAAFEAAEPARYSHIHFAAHAKANRESPLDSFVMLSPYEGRARLYAREVARGRLTADLVTLSACRSAGDRAYSGEGLVGLSWAFLRAGASHVIAGLWDVPDKPTSRIMTLLYEQLAAGRPPAEALRSAKLQYRKEAVGADRKPYSWAAFQVYERKAPER